MLSLLCLIFGMVVLQPRQNVCCTGLQQWLTARPAARAFLKLPDTATSPNTFDSIDNINNPNSTITLNEVIKDGYVFSLAVGPTRLQSVLPDEYIETVPNSSDNNNAPNTLDINNNNSIINIPNNLDILNGSIDSRDLVLQLQASLDPNTTSPNTTSPLTSEEIAREQIAGKQRYNFQNRHINLFQKSKNTILFIAFIVFITSFLQGATGLIYAMLMIPLLLWTGFGLADASMFTAVLSFFSTSIMVFRFKDDIQWNIIWSKMYLRIAAMAVGIFLLAILNMFKLVYIYQIIGLLLLLNIVSYWLFQTNKSSIPKQLSKLYNTYLSQTWLLFASDSFLKGMVGFGGQTIPLWVSMQYLTQPWSKNEVRAFISAAIWTLLPIQIILLLGTFGTPMFKLSAQSLIFLPIALVALYLGIWFSQFENNWHMWASKNLSFPVITVLIQGLLLCIGLFSLLAPYIGLL